MGDTAGGVDRQAPCGASGDELVHETGLAQAGVADDPDRSPIPDQGAFEDRFKLGALCVASDEPGQPAPGGDRREARARRPRSEQFVHSLTGWYALDLELAEVAELELA